MSRILIAGILLAAIASLKAQVFICYGDGTCGNDGGGETGRDDDKVNCCQHGVAPFGLSYEIEGVVGCNICPVDFGFVNPSFTAQESTNTYSVELAFFSGQSASGEFVLRFNDIQPSEFFPDSSDVHLTFDRIFFPGLTGSNDLEIRSAEILLRLDSTSQENNETFKLSFNHDHNFLPYDSNLRHSFVGVIVDTTRVTFELSEEDYREREGDTGYMPVRISKNSVLLANVVTFLVIPWTVQQAIDEGLVPIMIDVPESPMLSPNRADANDFDTSRISTEFEADEPFAKTSLDVPIRVYDDLVNEASEQYFIAEFTVVAAATMSLISLERRVSRCRIVDNDFSNFFIGFQLSRYEFLEPEEGYAVFNNVTIVKENNAKSEQTFGLKISFGDSGIFSNAATMQKADEQSAFDYAVGDPGNTTILTLFEPQDNEVKFSLTIFADNFAEGTEGFSVFLSSQGNPFPNFLVGSFYSRVSQNTQIYILDTDSSFFGFEWRNYTVSENSTAEVCVILKNPPLALDILLEVILTEVTADVSDFQWPSRFLDVPDLRYYYTQPYFMEGSLINRLCTRFPIYQDDLYEDTESFNLTLRLQTLDATGVVIDPLVTQIFILDQSQLTIGFINATYQASESDGFATVEIGILEGHNIASVYVSVTLSFSDLSAANGSDYVANDSQVFVFDSNTSTHTAMVSIINDDTFEQAEVLQANLEFKNGSEVPRVSLGPSTNITILDDFVFGFDPASYTVTENDFIEVLTVRQISGDTETFQFILSAATNDYNAEATAVADLDYWSNSQQLTPINIEQSSAEFLVEIVDNNLTELTKCFDVMLTDILLSNDTDHVPFSLIRFNPERAQVEILDDDIAIVGFSSATYTFLESEGVVSVSINVLQGNIAFNLSVSLKFFDESAISGGDYEAVNEEYIITGSGFVTVPINLTDDFIREETESFFTMLSFRREESFHNIMLTPNDTEVIIIDDDYDSIAPTQALESTIIVSATSTVPETSSLVPVAMTATGMTEMQKSSFALAGTAVPSQTATPSEQTTASAPIEMLALGIVFGVLGLTLLLTGIVVLLVWVKYRRKRKQVFSCHVAVSKKSKLGKIQGDFEMYNIYNKSDGLRHYIVQSSFKLKLPRSLMIPSCRLKLDSMLGQGEFGMVYKGFLKRGYSDAISDVVAVKTLKGFVEKESVHSLLKECGKMYTFDHPNILKLTGVCMDGGPAPYIIMPFMANGGLKDYLLKERSNFLLDPSSTDPEYAVTVEKRLLDMCEQVAKGMEYLASKRVIHRDLAARNCMLDVTNVIKVADFGLAESLDSSKDYIRQDQETTVKLPIKWLALESINDGIFSEKSDVWSFGVTCWEIFNGGKTPYPGIHPADIPKQLDEGMRLEMPKNAAVTDEIYSIMLKCWNSHSNLRPTFAELVKELSGMLGDMAGYLDL